jgi:hypothetical protein
MDLLFKGLNLTCSGFAFILIIFAVIKFRKERLFKPLTLASSAVLSTVILPIYLVISGIRLNFLLGFLLLIVGLGLGIVSGLTAKIRAGKPGIMGKQSWAAFLIWGLSLIFSILMNLSASSVTSALGVMPLCLTTGIQGSSNMILALRTLKLRHAQPVRAGG